MQLPEIEKEKGEGREQLEASMTKACSMGFSKNRYVQAALQGIFTRASFRVHPYCTM